MARRRSEKTEGPLTKAELDGLIIKVDLIKEEMLSHCIEEFTHDDYFELFVPSELRQAFRDIHKYAIMPLYYNNSFNVTLSASAPNSIHVNVNNYNGYKSPLVPIEVTLQPSASPELVDRVTSLVTERTRIITDFCRVKEVIKALNKYCETPSHMRFFWPQIATLAARAELTTLVEKMKFNPRDLCALPVGVRKACREAAITITQAQLLSDTSRPEIETALTFRINQFLQMDGDFSFIVSE